MFVIRVGLSSLVIFLFLAVSGLQAATVGVLTGKASINRGTGYQKISGTTQGKAGDSVMASPNGSAIIIYENGCEVEVNPGQVVTITTLPPCQVGAPQGVTPTQIAVGLGVAGAVTAAIIIISDDPASP